MNIILRHAFPVQPLQRSIQGSRDLYLVMVSHTKIGRD